MLWVELESFPTALHFEHPFLCCWSSLGGWVTLERPHGRGGHWGKNFQGYYTQPLVLVLGFLLPGVLLPGGSSLRHVPTAREQQCKKNMHLLQNIVLLSRRKQGTHGMFVLWLCWLGTRMTLDKCWAGVRLYGNRLFSRSQSYSCFKSSAPFLQPLRSVALLKRMGFIFLPYKCHIWVY